jgi:hypothetical protein
MASGPSLEASEASGAPSGPSETCEGVQSLYSLSALAYLRDGRFFLRRPSFGWSARYPRQVRRNYRRHGDLEGDT